MGKRFWLLICLIALESSACWHQWRDSRTLAAMHRTALALHAKGLQAQTAIPTHSGAATAGQPTLDTQAWALVQQGQAVRRRKVMWESLSFAGMASIILLGIWSFEVSRRETRRRNLAEAELRREQSSLEARIEARTAELQREVEERSRAEDRNRRQKRVLELLANGASLEEIFAELTASIAVQRRSWESAIHLVDADHESLELVASSRVSDRLEHYLKTIAAGFSDAPEGVAWSSGKPCFIASMIDQHRPWSEFLASNAIRSAWSLPLVVRDGRTLGTLTIYSRLFGIPDDNDREVLDAAVRLAVLVADVHRMNGELRRKAYEDELTGVANRRAGEHRLDQAIVRAAAGQKSFAVLWIDLDRFKRVNDLYGHSHGDEVLLATARRVAAHPRVNGAVARMGGDEFLVLLESCEQEQDAQQVASELAAAISEPLWLGTETATVGASIGITMFPRDGETPEDLERHADSAMYQAKRRSLGWCTFSPAIRTENDRTLLIEEGLRLALDTAPHLNLLEVHYQPIFAASGRLISLEALLRFRHPELGPVSPAVFIPIAEESGLILPLGRWVLRQVCTQMVEWQRAIVPALRAGVNISAVQWGRQDFVQQVRDVIRETGASPESLTFELTESVVMQNPAQAGEHMRELKQMGIRIAMDDFGTGYSSLSYLHQLPLDLLKIDRSFTARLGRADDSRTIVHSVVSMAHLLGMVTVAEGVENELQRRTLTELGCDALQGFLLARPMPAAAVADFVGTHTGIQPPARPIPGPHGAEDSVGMLI